MKWVREALTPLSLAAYAAAGGDTGGHEVQSRRPQSDRNQIWGGGTRT